MAEAELGVDGHEGTRAPSDLRAGTAEVDGAGGTGGGEATGTGEGDLTGAGAEGAREVSCRKVDHTAVEGEGRRATGGADAAREGSGVGEPQGTTRDGDQTGVGVGGVKDDSAGARDTKSASAGENARKGDGAGGAREGVGRVDREPSGGVGQRDGLGSRPIGEGAEGGVAGGEGLCAVVGDDAVGSDIQSAASEVVGGCATPAGVEVEAMEVGGAAGLVKGAGAVPVKQDVGVENVEGAARKVVGAAGAPMVEKEGVIALNLNGGAGDGERTTALIDDRGGARAFTAAETLHRMGTSGDGQGAGADESAGAGGGLPAGEGDAT